MKYIRITSIPVTARFSGFLSPAALLAARNLGSDAAIEYRVEKQNGHIQSYIGFEKEEVGIHLLHILAEHQFGGAFEENAGFVSNGIVLVRQASEKYRLVANQPYERNLILSRVSSEEEKLKSLFSMIERLPNGCGYAIILSAADQLDYQTTTFLKNRISANPDDDLCSELFRDNTYRCAVGVYGDKAINVNLLINELEYCFGGLAAVKETPISFEASYLWKNLSGIQPKAASCKSPSVLYHFLYSELEAMTAVNGLSMIPGGIAVNRDSIFAPLRGDFPQKGKNTISLGITEKGIEQTIALPEIAKHMFIAGAPGSGKGNLLFSLANQLYEKKIPVLMIESAKQEMHHLRKTIRDLKVWRPKSGEFLLNPFSIPPEVTMGDYRASLLQIIRTAFKGGGAESSLDELYAEALNRCLAKHGYTESSLPEDSGVIPFGLSEFIREYIYILEHSGYSEKSRRDMRTVGVNRLRVLFDQNPDVFDTVHSVPVSELCSGYNLLQLNCLTTLEAKQLFASILLIALSTYLRLRKRTPDGLQLVIVMDESHNLLKGVKNSSGSEYSFAEDFQNLMLELRSIGVGFIVCDQSALNIPPMISQVCATKVFLGSSEYSGLELYENEFKSDEYTKENLYALGPGEGVWHKQGMSGGAFFKTPSIIEKYCVNEDYPAENAYIANHRSLFCQTFNECAKCPSRNACNLKNKQNARRVANLLVFDHKARLSQALDRNHPKEEILSNIKGVFASIALDIVAKVGPGEAYCCAIQFVRHYNREAAMPLAENLVQLLYKALDIALNK